MRLQHMARHFEYLHAHLFSRLFRCSSTDIGRGRGICPRVKWCKVGITGVHDDVFHTHTQHLSCDLRNDSIGTRANIGRPYQDVEGAIIVEFDTGPTHVQARNSSSMHGE